MDPLGTSGESHREGDIDEGAGNLKQAASTEINDLIADVEDLLARIADLNDADVAKLRSRVVNALDEAKGSLAGNARKLRERAQWAATTADDYVRESPWVAVGVAALVGAVVGIVSARRS